MGAVTGGVSGGLGQVFSASGFWGSVGSSAFVGAGTGGVAALINGQNFLEGILKGAVIGGGVAGISYYGAKFFSTPMYSELTKAEYDALGIPDSGEALDPSINTLRKMYKESGWSKMNTGAKQFYVDNPSGMYIRKGDYYYNTKTGEDVIAYTRRNFWANNTSSLNFSKGAFASKMKLGITMVHELGHSTINFNPNLNKFLQVKTTNGYEPELLFPGAQGDLGKTTIEHGIIWGIERDFLKLNGFKDLPGFFDNSFEKSFNDYILNSIQFKPVYDKLKHLPVKLK
ncbi:hypothetical protein J2810_003694 [Chryseobacterium rhizosphaerae]|uniref:hypothetical protein n=1 Tax=Chryseobacterium rhizosphaerae TaxID=395937 RepID=UPI0006462C9B|nr:hypothetical protein [Chryseobacterium rhizosphaerae]MDR6547609.1 hypothetical protein [Chryseobacterium rhizosphaerae]